MPVRVSPTGRIHRHIDELLAADRPLPEILEEVARLELGVLLSDPVLDQWDHDRDHQCPDRQVVCGGRLRRGE